MKARVPEAEAKGRVLGFSNPIFCLTGESSSQPCVAGTYPAKL